MQIISVEPNTQAWLDIRLEHLCASEAPIVMGVGFQSRNWLLKQKKGWVDPEVDSRTQERFDRGHRAEALQRPIVEGDHICTLNPVCAVLKHEGLNLWASFDGLEVGVQPTVWEHKLWNEKLAENVRNGLIAPRYYWQLEQQAFIANVTEVLFTVSDGSRNKKIETIYTVVPGRIDELLSAWHKFESDLANYELEPVEEKIQPEVSYFFPALPKMKATVTDDTQMIVSNLDDAFIDNLREISHRVLTNELKTDQDFVDAESLVKNIATSRVDVKAHEQNVVNCFPHLKEFQDKVKIVDKALQIMQASLDRKVKTEKESRKTILIEAASKTWTSEALQAASGIPELKGDISFFAPPDWRRCISGKRNYDNIRDALDQAVTDSILELNNVLSLLQINLMSARDRHIEKRCHLFPDLISILNQPTESFLAVVDARIKQHFHLDDPEHASGPIPPSYIKPVEKEDVAHLPDFVETARIFFHFFDSGEFYEWKAQNRVTNKAVKELEQLVQEFVK